MLWFNLRRTGGFGKCSTGNIFILDIRNVTFFKNKSMNNKMEGRHFRFVKQVSGASVPCDSAAMFG